MRFRASIQALPRIRSVVPALTSTTRMRIVPSIGTLVLSVLRAISDPFVPTAQLYFLVEDGFKRPSGALS